jgi:hypothetical protein
LGNEALDGKEVVGLGSMSQRHLNFDNRNPAKRPEAELSSLGERGMPGWKPGGSKLINFAQVEKDPKKVFISTELEPVLSTSTCQKSSSKILVNN